MGPGYVAYLAFLSLWALLVLSVGTWVYADAAAHGSSSPALWAVGSALVWPIGAYYLFLRRRSEGRTRPPDRRQRLAATVALASAVAIVAAGLLAPPDPVSTGLYAIAAFVLAVPICYYLLFERRKQGPTTT